MKKSKLLALSLIGLSAVSLASCGPKTEPVDPTKYTYELTIEPNKSFLKSEKRSVKKLANGDAREIIDYEFIVPKKEVAEVTNYNDLLIGANPLLLTPIALEMNDDIVVRTLTAEETKSEFNPITEFSKSGYGDANIDSSLYNTEQLRTCYSISQSESGTLQSKYYNVSIVIEDNEAPVLANSSASIPYSTSIDVIKKELTNSIISSLTDNNSLAQFTVTLYNDVIKNTYDDIGKSQTIHFDATDDAGNKLENAIFTYILVNDYLTNIDQTTVHEISYRNANLNTIKTAYGINTEYTYELLNEDELVTNEGTITEELKEAINVEQTAKYKIIENNVEIGTFEYKFKIIDDVAPVMKWVDDNSIIDVDYLNDLTKEHDNNLNYNFFTTEFLTPVDLYNELKKYVYASDDISNCKLYLKVEISESKNILVYFYFLDESLNISKQIRFGAAITDDGIFNYDECIKNYIPGIYDENGLVETL